LLNAGKPNLKIIKERKLITGRRLDALIKILEKAAPDSEVIVHACFEPQHAIFIIKTVQHTISIFALLAFKLKNLRKFQ
jgi:hypothetical protein